MTLYVIYGASVLREVNKTGGSKSWRVLHAHEFEDFVGTLDK